MTPDNDPLTHLDWPFMEPKHRLLACELEAWARDLRIPQLEDHQPSRETVDSACRQLVKALGDAGFLRLCVDLGGGSDSRLDTRSICIAREIFARHHALMDFAFAMQGLGSGAISLVGTALQRSLYLKDVAAGKRIAAFALSEPDAGSDVGAMQCTAERIGESFVLNGEKTWISNGGIADFYVVFARTPGSQRSNGISAFIIDAGTPGFEVAERIDVISPHPLARLSFKGCRVPEAQLLGEEGGGFKLAMQTLDIFRTSVAAAGLGFARSAMNEALYRANTRKIFGSTLGSLQLVQSKIAQMACSIDSSALQVYRAAWLKDQGKRVTREAAMAKLVATESAQIVIDQAVQIFGGEGVRVGSKVEQLYRDIRALRIYEGATEVQEVIIATDVLRSAQRANQASVSEVCA
ncbi:acyl-CoA dehydrogenase family protein [Ottowia thiooxydans]|uniref:acyl-CoA dehydrogenase family protein n=1 Tax=Ottowia thiooxydans TaxID=219182 RepID=UPI00040A339F|nr:acyl-CoA dehydrogenase family protein [Ottowia thiooxydans]